MAEDEFRVTLSHGCLGDVFLDFPDEEIPWEFVETLDKAGFRAVTYPKYGDAPEFVRSRLTKECDGVAGSESTPFDTDTDLDEFLNSVCRARGPIPNYALFVGRLERDFSHARSAIRACVECHAGIHCLWVDDGRHRTNDESIRRSTAKLIEHARLVVADLTLGDESPGQENPSRAHEIGMALAYERPTLIISQEPRRYPYYSISDMQLTFWNDEQELYSVVERWIADNDERLGRRVLNNELTSPAIEVPAFEFDLSQRFIGPNLRVQQRPKQLLNLFGLR